MFCVFVGCLPGITRPGYFTPGLRRTSLRGRGDVPRLAVPPAHDYRSLNSGNNLLSTLSTLSTLSYNVLHFYARLAFDSRLWKWLASSPHRLWERYYYNNPAPIEVGDCN